ncbi:hypothetical protein GE061_006391 [Apolygus lucorum]|uniref:Peptidase C1A papain C-terminal domain-containing protein n=1 Tax=Apolygus lucorum TaxID=248454 RepID=A0A6A4J120_APOLU|nr:hypothetical protein GE061_006391 [Apolygus lucorum]
MVVSISFSTQQTIEFTEEELADYNKLIALVRTEGAKQAVIDYMNTDLYKSAFRSLREYVYSSVEAYKNKKRQFWLRLNRWSVNPNSTSYLGTYWDEVLQNEVDIITAYLSDADRKLQMAFLEATGHNFKYNLLQPMPWQVKNTPLIIPKIIDWRLKGTIDSPVNKYHFNCKASYPFAVAATIDAHINHHRQFSVPLSPTSPQMFLSCPYANDMRFLGYNPCKDDQYGANGTPDAIVRSYEFAVINGIISAESWKYVDGESHECPPRSNDFLGILQGYVILPKGKKAEVDLMIAVALYGPVTVSFEYSEQNYELLKYGGGIYDQPCAKGKLFTMVVIGYGEDNGKPYWLLMNNFGPEWGQYGYIKIARSSPTACDITQQMIFPVISKVFPILTYEGNIWTNANYSKAVRDTLLRRYNYTDGDDLPPALKLSNDPDVWV